MDPTSASYEFMKKIQQIDINNQMVALNTHAKKGESEIYVNPLHHDWMNYSKLIEDYTLLDLFEYAVKNSSNRPMLGKYKTPTNPNGQATFEFLTYAQVQEKVNRVKCGLFHLLQTCPNFSSTHPELDVLSGEKHLNTIGLFSKNRIEWVITDLSCISMNVTSVGLFDTYSQEQLEFVVLESEVSIIVCDGSQIYKLLRTQTEFPNLKYIVCMDQLQDNEDPKSDWAFKVLDEWSKSKGIKLLDFYQLEELGQKYPGNFQRPKSNDIYTLCYTSGTTGMPKGAKLSHKNILHASIYMSQQICDKFPNSSFSVLSYLPLSHIYERIGMFGGFRMGIKMGFWRNDPKKLVEDLQVFKPTIFNSVPRVLNRIYNIVMNKVDQSHPAFSSLFRYALNVKINGFKKGYGVHHGIWDTLIFNKLKKVLGGNLLYVISGSAPIKGDVLDGLCCMFCTQVAEGYGSTETATGCTLTLIHDSTRGHVGSVVPYAQLKFKDVPEMNYVNTPSNPQGEICIKGPNLLLGYYKNMDKYKESFDEEGFFLTGDIGILTSQKTLKLVDRKSNIIKLSQGEYVSLERIESVFSQCDLVLMNWIYGDSFQPSLVGIFVVNPESFLPWAKKFISNDQTLEELCQNDIIIREFLCILNRIAEENNLKGYEKLKAIHLESNPFTPDQGLVTPTLKVKRKNLKIFYQSKLDQLYEKIDL